jgi:hypothetical protein
MTEAHCVIRGVPLKSVQKRMGHATPKTKKAPESLGLGGLIRSAQGGIRTQHGRMENFKQDAPSPTISLILLGFVIPSRPILSHLVPRLIPHRSGTWARHATASGLAGRPS